MMPAEPEPTDASDVIDSVQSIVDVVFAICS